MSKEKEYKKLETEEEACEYCGSKGHESHEHKKHVSKKAVLQKKKKGSRE